MSIIAPYFHRSMFDDFDDIVQDMLSPLSTAMTTFPLPGHRRHKRPQKWTATVQLSGYRPSEVNIERADDNSFVKVHARRTDGDDFSETRRTVQVPENVDRNQLDVQFTREGALLLQAPYQYTGTTQSEALVPHNQEMRALENDMWGLANQSFPGMIEPHFVQGEDGTTKLNLDFNLAGYKPEEITVSQEGDYVNVEAKHESNSEQGSSYKHYKRIFNLPKNVDTSQLSSRLLRDGHLRLEAPCNVNNQPKQQEALSDQEIPVKRIGKSVE